MFTLHSPMKKVHSVASRKSNSEKGFDYTSEAKEFNAIVDNLKHLVSKGKLNLNPNAKNYVTIEYKRQSSDTI